MCLFVASPKRLEVWECDVGAIPISSQIAPAILATGAFGFSLMGLLCGRWDEDRQRIKLAMQQNQKLAMPPIRETTTSSTDARLKSLDTQ